MDNNEQNKLDLGMPTNRSFQDEDDYDMPHTNRNLIREQKPDIYNEYQSVSVISINPHTLTASNCNISPGRKEVVNSNFQDVGAPSFKSSIQRDADNASLEQRVRLGEIGNVEQHRRDPSRAFNKEMQIMSVQSSEFRLGENGAKDHRLENGVGSVTEIELAANQQVSFGRKTQKKNGTAVSSESSVYSTSQIDGQLNLPSKNSYQYLNLEKQTVSYTSRRSQNFEDSCSEADENIETDGKNQDGAIRYLNTQGKESVMKSNIRFQNYRKIFQALLKQSNIITLFPIVSMQTSYDSTRAISVQKNSDKEFWITMFSLETYEETFTEKVGGEVDSYIKLKDIEQNEIGDQYACVYFNDGLWILRTFGKLNRSQEEIKANEVVFNHVLGLDAYTMANEAFQDPFATCCFIDDETLYINIFHNYQMTHYQFIWDIKLRKIKGKVGLHKLSCNLMNFPIKSFYSETRRKIYTFYRQAECFMIDPKEPEAINYSKISNKPLDQMELIYGEALVVRSSNSILFFRQVVDDFCKTEDWQEYHSIKIRAFIYYIKGNIRIQVTTDDLVYFYIIDRSTFMPILENVMDNYMNCNQCMFGKRVRYGITYKLNERNFDIYTRKYMHNLKINVIDENFEGAFGLSLPSMNIFLVAKVNQIIIFNSDTYKAIDKIPIKLLESVSREPNEVIGMAKSNCDQWLAVISGKNLVMDQQAQNQIFIFQAKLQLNHSYKYEQVDRIVVKDEPFFQGVCMQFYFKDFEGDAPTDFIFCKRTEIFTMNIMTRSFTSIHTFQPALLSQPKYYCVSKNQKIHVLASENDGYWINQETDKEVDLDEVFNVDQIKQIVYDKDEGQFYFLANKKAGKLGFFMKCFDEKDPLNKIDITLWDTLLNIDDVSLEIIRSFDPVQKIYNKELVISYKTININTYNVWVYDLSQSIHKRSTLYIHERFQLWESSIRGLFLDKNKEFITLSKVGIEVLNLGTMAKRKLVDNIGNEKMLHSLAASNFLKMDKHNHIKYHCQDYNNRIISIEQEIEKKVQGTNQFTTKFFPVYKIKIHEITLRELMILQSFYFSKTTANIQNLVKLQPQPKLFYKAYLEFDMIPMVSILAFDSSSMQNLLNDSNSEYFDQMYPIFYKNKIPKKKGPDYYYRNAIDNAIRNNQIRSAQYIIDYIIKYQNNYVSTPLFMNRLQILIEKGVMITDLLDSRVFVSDLNYEDWPSTHFNQTECSRPYVGNIFYLSNKYQEVFPEDEYAPMEFGMKTSKVHKIKYQVNLLPFLGSHFYREAGEKHHDFKNIESELMHQFAQSEEMDIYQTLSLTQLVDYKWDSHAQSHHIVNCYFHVLYILVFIAYVIFIYEQEPTDMEHRISNIILSVMILYPWAYESIQLYKEGLSTYLKDPWNWADVLYYTTNISNCILQFTVGSRHLASMLCMSIIVILLVVKTFFFLRIFRNFTPIVIMLKNVMYDLRIFLLFYTILLFIFSLLFNVLGVGLSHIHEDLKVIAEAQEGDRLRRRLQTMQKFENMTPLELQVHPQCSCYTDSQYRRMLKPKSSGGGSSSQKSQPSDSASGGAESDQYKFFGMFVGQFFATFRVSLGDNDLMGGINDFPPYLVWCFWLVWLLAVVLSNIVFLNFIIAEASASYSHVSEQLESTINKEKINMILEAETMTMQRNKTKNQYPPFIIIRSIET